MTSSFWTTCAFAMIALCIFLSKQFLTMTIPIFVEIEDSSYSPENGQKSLLCWINPDIGLRGIDTIIRRLPAGCDQLAPGIRTNTFVGHQFLVVNPDNTVDSPPKVITVTNKAVLIDIQKYENYNSTDNFDFLVEWHRLLLSRQIIATSFAAALAIALYLIGSDNQKLSKVDDERGSKSVGKTLQVDKRVPYETVVPRNVMKCYAVITMVLNHFGHIFVRNYAQLRPVFTTLADGGGSSHLFNWLVGYNLSDNQKSPDVLLLLAYIFLQMCLDLPFPITYETLLSIAIIRCVLRLKGMNVDPSTGRCWAADAHIMYHALLCCLLVVSDLFIGSEGLKIVSIHGVMYAFSGRLFALRNADFSKVLLWLTAGVALNSFGLRFNFLHTYAGSNLRYLYAATFIGLTLFHGSILAIRREKPAGVVKLPLWVKAVSHYSLEIYVAHFVIFYACYVANLQYLFAMLLHIRDRNAQ